MTAPSPPRHPGRSRDTADLESLLSAVEQHLQALGNALRQRQRAPIELHAARLQAALARAIDAFSHASKAGRIPDTLRARLVRASDQVASQRDTLRRASLALDSTLDVLLPRERPIVYAHPGHRVPPVFSH